ncbi:MAG: class I tRNA ligase family protein, partial [Promethearchaeia archaeon]
NKRLQISNDFYIRTTMPMHKALAQKLFLKATDAGDIYLANYDGWYNVKEETFVTESEAQQTDYKDPASGLPLE